MAFYVKDGSNYLTAAGTWSTNSSDKILFSANPKENATNMNYVDISSATVVEE